MMEHPAEEDNIEAMFAQMDMVLQANGSSLPAGQDDQSYLNELIRKCTYYGDNLDARHSTCKPECTVINIKVYKYHGAHLCAIVKDERVCLDPNNSNLHSHIISIDLNNFFLCTESGNVHQCGDNCTVGKYLSNKDNEYVCPISGMVLGVEFKGEWWTDKEKMQHNALRGNDIEMDEDVLEYLVDRTVKRTIKNEKGEIVEKEERIRSEITFVRTPPCHSQPWEKSYFHYLMRCKNILWMLLYSAKRQQFEIERLQYDHTATIKVVEKYARNCCKKGDLKQWHFIRALVRATMKHGSGIAVWIPPLHIMEALLFHYSRIITKFFWIVLDNTSYGKEHLTHFPFDYFVLACVNIMAQCGLSVNNHIVLAFDPYMKAQLPDINLLQKFGINTPTVNRVRNSINSAVSISSDPKVLVFKVTQDDPWLFRESFERYNRNQRENYIKRSSPNLNTSGESDFSNSNATWGFHPKKQKRTTKLL